MRQTWRDCSCRDDGIRACRIQPAPKSPEAGELHGRTGSRSISCVSVFIKTLSNFLYPSVLASCHTLYFFPSQSCWAAVGQGSVLGPVLPCGSPRAAPGRAMALLGCRQPQVCWLSKALISNLAGSSGDWIIWIIFSEWKRLCTGHGAGSSCDAWARDNFALVPVLRSRIWFIWIWL